MTDCEFLKKLTDEGKIEWFLFGSVGMWKVLGTKLTLKVDQNVKEEGNCWVSHNEWRLVTTRYTIVVKSSVRGTPLEDFWNGIDFEEANKEQERLDEWFSGLPDY